MMSRIVQIIEDEIDLFKGEESLAESLRAAAWYVMDEFPEARAADFGHAAAGIGLHKQGAINRWNEAKKNMEIALGK